MARRRLELECLEDRRLPATFGIPWADPSRLSISFAPDGTEIAGRASSLFESLNQDRSSEEWQYDILRAFHTWASVTNLDIAIVPDSGSAFGTSGRLQGDPRFGDIRIGGNTLSPEILAVSSPPDPGLAGTLAGDVFLNVNYPFKDSPYDLYSVMLHEAGHALGLDHSQDPNSPMFLRFNNTKSSLTVEDIARIRNLYGTRKPDSFEGALGNEALNTAAAIPVPSSYAGATPLLAFADLRTANDVDVFWFDTVPDRDENQNITILVQTAGLSLLAPKVTVFTIDDDGKPKEVANVKADSADFTGAVLSVTFDGNDDDDDDDDDFRPRRYFVRIEHADDAPFRIGRYALAVTFDGLSTVAPEHLSKVVTGPYASLGANDLAALLSDPDAALVRRDLGTNESIRTATSLSPTVNSRSIRRFEYIASLESPRDVDTYRIVSPVDTSSRVLLAHVWALPGQGIDPRIEILDATGSLVGSEILVNDSGSYTVQANGIEPNTVYYLRVTAQPGISPRGNYVVNADFRGVATELRLFATGQLSVGNTRTDTLYVGQSQLFHLILNADPADLTPGLFLQMTITDSRGMKVFELTTRAGESTSGPAVLLRPGTYQVHYRAFSASGNTSPIRFRVLGNRITDPIGPVVDDPTLKPEFGYQRDPIYFLYPGPYLTTDPFHWRLTVA